MRFVQSYARIPYMGLPINGPKWAEVRAISARAHAHAYPHTPTRICMRTYTCSSFKETEHWRGGLSLRILSSEERLRRAPFLTVLGERERESERAIERATTAPAFVGPAPFVGPALDAHPVVSTWPIDLTLHVHTTFSVSVLPVARGAPPAHAGSRWDTL